MKKLHLLTVVLPLVALLAACSSDSFKIDGELTHLDNSRVRVVMRSDSSIVDEWVSLDNKGRFSFTGEAEQPVLVMLMRHNGDLLTTVVAANGDHIKVKGDASQPMGVKVKGNKLNEAWQMFRDEHKDFYISTNPARLDAAIEKYVRENPGEMLSTVLLMADYSDYSDRGKVEKLLKGIDVAARPESLSASFWEAPAAGVKRHQPRLMVLELYKHGGGFEKISLADRMTLLSLWANPQDNRQAVSKRLQDFNESAAGKDVRVIDILAEGDTMRWHKTIAGEAWPHYWAPAGPVEKGIQLLGVTTMPWYAVTDSSGLVVYSGPNLDQAIHAASAK